MKFTYKAKSNVDKVAEGTIDAPGQAEALDLLWKEGLFPLEIAPCRETGQPVKDTRGRKRMFLKGLPKTVPARQIQIFTQKLSTLIRSRVDLLSALKIVHEQTDHPLIKEVVSALSVMIREGKTLSESLGYYSKVFSPLYVNIIRAGESSGSLNSALEQIGEFQKREEALRNKVSLALAYPAMLLFMGMASVFVLINFVIPRLKPIFDNLGEDIPLMTKIVFHMSEISQRSWAVIAGVVLAAGILTYFYKGNVFLKRILRRGVRFIPIIKKITQNQELAYFSRSMGMLLKSGVPAIKSVATTIPGIEDTNLREGLERSLKKIAAGESLFKSLQDIKGFPSFFTSMIAVGEQSGRLTEIFDELSRSCTQEIETDISLLSALLEPLLILILGLILGALVISILIPLFQLTQMVG